MFWYYFHDPSANGARARGFQSWHIKFFSLWKIPLFFNFAQISTLGNFTTFFDLWIQGYNLYIFQIFLNPPLNNSQKSKLKGFEQKKSCWWPSGPSWRRVLLEPPPGVYQRPYYPWPIGLTVAAKLLPPPTVSLRTAKSWGRSFQPSKLACCGKEPLHHLFSFS